MTTLAYDLRDRMIGVGEPVLKRYERIAFEKSLRRAIDAHFDTIRKEPRHPYRSPVPKTSCQYRFTVTRAVRGFSGLTSHCATPSSSGRVK